MSNRCLCCGAFNGNLFRLASGLYYATCDKCLRGCSFCAAKVNGATLVKDSTADGETES